MPASEGWNPPGRRYMPASGATLQVTFLSLDSNKQVARTATQPFPTSDPSIWRVQMLSTDGLVGTVNVLLTLTEGIMVTRGSASGMVGIQAQVPPGC